MVTEVLAVERSPAPPVTSARPPPRRRKWVIAVAAFAGFAAAMGYVTGNEVQANTQFDQTHHALSVTRHRIDVVLAELATVRHDLSVVNGQVSAYTTALAQDTTQLKGVQAALANAQSDVSHQTSTIADLHTCLGGVEQALNALAVSDQNRAVGALDAVATSCTNAAASSG
jgi:chromosome segregation ATPase